MKIGLSIEITDLKDYRDADLYIYKKLIEKLMYLSCDTKPDIIFVVRQLNRHKVNPRKDTFEL